jgi:cytochrome P450
VSVAAYNLVFHPLRRFPGSLLSRATIFPNSLHCLRGDFHTWNAAQHAKYGPIVRIAPDIISFTSNAWKDIYASRPQFQKDPTSYNNPPNGVPGLLSARDDQYHQKTRKIFSPAFSEKALRAQEGLSMTVPLFIVQPSNGLQFLDMLMS